MLIAAKVLLSAFMHKPAFLSLLKTSSCFLIFYAKEDFVRKSKSSRYFLTNSKSPIKPDFFPSKISGNPAIPIGSL